MSNPPKATALTDEQIITRLGEEVMGWKKRHSHNNMWWWNSGSMKIEDDLFPVRLADGWNPLADWNHWRQVEEKMMENKEILQRFLWLMLNEDGLVCLHAYMRADLSTRCKALISALDSLPPPSHDLS